MRIALSLLAMLLAAPVASPDYEAIAREVLANIVAGDFSAATKDFNETMLAGLPAEKLKSVHASQLAPALGAFQSAGDAIISNRTVTIPVKFEKAEANFVVNFDNDGKSQASGSALRNRVRPCRRASTITRRRRSCNCRSMANGSCSGAGGRWNYHVITVDQHFAYDLVINRNGSTFSGDRKKTAQSSASPKASPRTVRELRRDRATA